MNHELILPGKEVTLPSWAFPFLDELQVYHPDTFEHGNRVGKMTYGLWEDFRGRPKNANRMFRISPLTMYTAGVLHDVGKLDIPKSILDKPGHLDHDEERVMINHTEAGYEKIKAHDPIVAQIIRGHHLFGRNGLVYDHTLALTDDEEIRDAQMITAVADKIDASFHRGPHGGPRTIDEVAALIPLYFAQELKSSAIEQDQLILALRYAQHLGTGS